MFIFRRYKLPSIDGCKIFISFRHANTGNIEFLFMFSNLLCAIVLKFKLTFYEWSVR